MYRILVGIEAVIYPLADSITVKENQQDGSPLLMYAHVFPVGQMQVAFGDTLNSLL